MDEHEKEVLPRLIESCDRLPEDKQKQVLAYAQGMEAMLDKYLFADSDWEAG